MVVAVARKLLGEMMSEISERCWYAGWMLSAEYVLWQAVVEGPASWGHGTISEADIATLKALWEEAGGWIMFDQFGPDDEVIVANQRWREIYKIWATSRR